MVNAFAVVQIQGLTASFVSLGSELNVKSSKMPESKPITLCHLGPSPNVPTISTFVLKLETYLRMTDIPYAEEFTFNHSSKGKMPYIKDDRKEVADSNFIIPYLNKKFGKDLNKNLSPIEKASSLAFKRLIEENLYWTLVYFNWNVNYSKFSKQLPVTGFRKAFLPIAAPISVKPKWRSMLHGHGMGRHSKEEILAIMEEDMTAISIQLGDKQFFFGDEPTEIDAALFGVLGIFLYAAPDCPQEKLMREKLTNLVDYTERMKTKYFPDWEKKSRNGRKKEAATSKNQISPEQPSVQKKVEEKPVDIENTQNKNTTSVEDIPNAHNLDAEKAGMQTGEEVKVEE